MRPLFLSLAMLLMAGCQSAGIQRGRVNKDVMPPFYPGAFSRLDYAMARESERGDIPAAQVAIRSDDRLVYTNFFGDIDNETLFDVASLTKALAGVPVATLLTVDEERKVTLTRHTSGLSDRALYPEILRELEQGRFDLSPVLQYLTDQIEPGSCYEYANVNYLCIGFLVAESGLDIREGLRRSWKERGAIRTQYPPIASDNVALSGYDALGDKIYGRPYDPVADAMLSTTEILPLHSGLFSTAEEAAMLFDDLRVGEKTAATLFAEHPVAVCGSDEDEFITVTDGGLLVEETPSGERVYTITGYTGCLLWYHPESKTTLVLISNAAADGAIERWQEFSADIVAEVERGLK